MSSSPRDDALFVYGTLVEPAIRERLLGRRVEAIAARLAGFERGRRQHFYLARRVGAETVGMVLLGLTARDFEVLDDYEDVPRLYTRGRIEVAAEGGAPIRCWVYLPTS